MIPETLQTKYEGRRAWADADALKCDRSAVVSMTVPSAYLLLAVPTRWCEGPAFERAAPTGVGMALERMALWPMPLGGAVTSADGYWR